MRRIAQETINRVLEEVNIFDVISQYVDLKKRGKFFYTGLLKKTAQSLPTPCVAKLVPKYKYVEH